MPVINMEQTGKQITELRKNANLTVNDIKEALASDIISVYYYQRGSMQYSLKHDKQMAEAMKLLTEPTEYKKILLPKWENIAKYLHANEIISNFAAFSGMGGSERVPHFILI